MTETKQLFDVIPNEVINNLIDYYNTIGVYDTSTMNKASPGKAVDLLKEILEDTLGKNLVYAQGNFYKHETPYLPHTDYKTYQDGKINLVIPLEYSNTLPHLVIFDQEWHFDSITWCMHHPVQSFKVNTGVKGCPHEYPVLKLTQKDIDDILYFRYLNHYPKNTLFGLSGNAYPFRPGSMIIFDSRRIHCTSKMSGTKLGLTLRFK